MIIQEHPLTPLQTGMLYQTLALPGSSAYIVQSTIDFQEDLDPTLFWKAWEEVIARHTILRSSVEWEGSDGPRMLVHDYVPIPFMQQDLRSYSDSNQSRIINDYMQNDRMKEFDLHHAPLFRLALFQQADTRFFCVRTYHHLISDGQSTIISWCELFDIYSALRKNLTPELPNATPYGEYAVWLNNKNTQGAASFWTAQLSGVNQPTLPATMPSAAELIVDDPKGQLSYFPRFETCIRDLGASLADALQIIADQNEATLNTVVQTAWSILLARYSGSQDIVFGATRAGRRSALDGHYETLLGPVINVVPVHVSVNPGMELPLLIKDLRARWIAMREFQYCSIPQISSWTNWTAGKPLFECLYNYDSQLWDLTFQQHIAGWRHRHFDAIQYPPNPLTLSIYARPSLQLRLTFDRTKYNNKFANRLLLQMQTLLEAMAANPYGRVSELELIPDRQRAALFLGAEITAPDLDKWQSAPEIFEQRVQKQPTSPAIIFQDQQITYQQLNERSNSIAHTLVSLDLPKETPLGILSTRCPAIIAAMLGVLKAGLPFILLDHNNNHKWLNTVIHHSGIKAVLTNSANLMKIDDDYQQDSLSLIMLDDLGNLVETVRGGEKLRNPEIQINPEDLAFVTHNTEKSTSLKGTMVSHKVLANMIRFQSAQIEIQPESRIVQHASFSSDVFLWQVWMALGNGAVLMFAPQDPILDPVEFLTWLKRNKINIFAACSSTLTDLADKAEMITALDDLETIISFHDACPQWVMEQWARDRSLLSVYGAAETGICIGVGKFDTKQNDDHIIGHLLPGTQAFILDKNLELTPQGIIGDLYISGTNLSRGYMNNPGLTAAIFNPNPFVTSGERLICTGDRVCLREDGLLELVLPYELNDLTKGIRTNLTEIELALTRHSAIKEAALIALKKAGKREVIAFVVIESSVSAAEILSYLHGQLPADVIPASLHLVESIPQTLAGQIDRRRLEKLAGLARVDSIVDSLEMYYEKELRKIWEEVLVNRQIGVHDCFYEIGGHSIDATRLVARIEDRFDTQLSLSLFLELQTIHRLAKYLAANSEKPKIPPELNSKQLPKYPITEGQRAIWEKCKSEGMFTYSNLFVVFRIARGLDLQALNTSLQLIAQRHEALRIIFREDAGRVFQLIRDDFVPKLQIEMIDKELLDEETDLEEIIIEFNRFPINFTGEPPWRVKLVKTSNEISYLFFSFHKLIFDKRSLALFLFELGKAYRAIVSMEIFNAPSYCSRYVDFTHDQQEWLNTVAAHNQRDFWLGLFTERLPVLRLPFKQNRPSIPSLHYKTVSIEASGEIRTRLDQISSNINVSAYSVLLGVYSLLLGRIANQTGPYIITSLDMRELTTHENLLGNFRNNVMFPVRWENQIRVADFLQNVQRMVLEIFENRFYPFEMISPELQLMPSSGKEKFPRVVYDYSYAPNLSIDLTGCQVDLIRCEVNPLDFDLRLRAVEYPDKLTIYLDYQEALFTDEIAVGLINLYTTLLRHVIDNPRQRIEHIPFTDEETLYMKRL